jgi:hypothetical protein
MADLGPALGALGELAAPLLGRALRAFIATTFGMLTLGVLVAVGSVYALGDKGGKHMLLGALCAVLLFTVGGFALAGQRAVGSALLEGLKRAQLGTRTVRALFDALAATRGAQALERLPLAQAEEKLRAVAHQIITSPVEGGGLRASLGRKIRNGLVEKVEALTVKRFRAEGADAGGIDVKRIGEELAAKADDALADQVRGLMTRATLVIVLGACLAQTLAVWALYTQLT